VIKKHDKDKHTETLKAFYQKDSRSIAIVSCFYSITHVIPVLGWYRFYTAIAGTFLELINR